MSDIAISVENISKRYRIGDVGRPSYHRLSEMITGVPRALLNYGRSAFKPSKDNPSKAESENNDEFWALNDVNFEVKQGEVVGIIGRNGAGKSTLLKILSRITEPTSGRFGIRGRVASLLEVGTGFHPELTGRENIYVSGVTLGMSRAEIKKRFDEIVDFSGVERFIETPVKHYSSGMQVRLGFAVAAHLESEILIVDEVLAVGDSEFQEKCIGAMTKVSKCGRTVLVVSHNMPTIRRLCNAAVLLKRGFISRTGSVEECVGLYLSKIAAEYRSVVEFSPTGDAIELARAAIETDQSSSETFSGTADISERVQIRLNYIVNSDLVGTNIAVGIYRNGIPVFMSFDTDSSPELLVKRKAGTYTATISFPPMLLKPGQYVVAIGAGTVGFGAFFHFEDALIFDVESRILDISSKGYHADREGLIIAPATWSMSLNN
jgi:lipopolysaccharide transport system ATP-binding protein